MHACRLQLDNHSPLNCQKRAMPQSRRFRKGQQPHQRSIGSICMRASLAAVKTAAGSPPCSQRRQSWTLAAQSLPYLQAPRRRTRFGTRLVVESELLDCESRPTGASKNTRPQGTTIILLISKTLLRRSKCTMCKHINSANSDARYFTKQQRPVRSSHPC